MIIKLGIKTLEPQLVAYQNLKSGENEAEAFAKLNALVYEKGAQPKDPTMIIYYDPKGSMDCRREVFVPVDREVEGLKTKMISNVKAGFIVYSGTKNQPEHYYQELLKYIESRGLKPSLNKFCSLEAVYQPDNFNLSTGSFIDEDAQETWTTEILIPIES